MPTRLHVQLVGPVRLLREDVPLPLPRSRKVVGLLAYLALESSPQSRSRLCDLFWDGPTDPRAELRWCLSKLRSLLDDADRSRVTKSGNLLVALDLSDVLLDTREIEQLASAGLHAATSEQLVSALARFRGDVIEGIELDATPELSTWLTGRRQAFRALRVGLARELAERPAGDVDQAHARLEAWLALDPFEQHAHQSLLALLLSAGRRREAEEHLSRALRAFERQGLDASQLRALRLAAPRAPAPPASVQVVGSAPSAASERRRQGRVSVAVMPFSEVSPAEAGTNPLGPGLSDDVITRLAKLRALFVIARGTTYVLGERGIDPREAGRMLAVEYVVSGRVRRQGQRVLVNVELAETADARIIWTDELSCAGEAAFSALDAIVDRVVVAIAKEIEAAECQRALAKPPSSLDAWEAYHRGLWHMYKFRPLDNLEAEGLFRSAIGLDPGFARAHAGLSFTHFQNVFLDLTSDRAQQLDLAHASALQSLAADDRDPAAHWALGRALWLRGAQEASIGELERSIELSPNFALGHYTLGFVHAQSGDPVTAIRAADTSRALSPFDPLQFGMLGSLALAHLRLGEHDAAADWGLAAIARPNAHVHILAIAACALASAGRKDEARELVARMRSQVSGYDVERFLRAFRFDSDAEQLLRDSARAIQF